ncbi:MAG: hypothetical protein LBD55_11515 [Treponema sp.]|jgi:predicted exporter|nr:hypothetical protein [Treponema sp.]
MKKPSSLFNKPQWPLAVWLLFHGGAAVVLGLSILFVGPIRLNTNLFDILPNAHVFKFAEPAEKVLGDRNSRHLYILAGNPDFTAAKQGAVQVYDAFADSGVFESLSLYADETAVTQFTRYLYDYRYVLLDAETRSLLEKGGAVDIAGDALASVFGAFNFVPLDTIETDPFLLAGRGMRHFLSSSLLSSGAMSPRDDVLAARHEGIWYVMLRGTLTREGVSLTNGDGAVKKIYAVCEGIKRSSPGTAFIYSGVPFHSYESSSNARREISFISSITLIIIIALFRYVFRSPLPVLVSASAAGVSILFATGSALLWFREIHVLTFVFGTTLIGTCVDYSVHYFIHWKGNAGLATGGEIRSHILRGITMSFISTAICFIALFFAPFDTLKQFAVFSLTGLFSSFLSVICLYPLLKKGKTRERRCPPVIIRLPPICKKTALSLMLGGAALALFINRDKVRVENNIAALYTMSGALLEAEKIAARVLNHGSSGWYFIVSGTTPEETLEHEEGLRERLELEIARGNLQSYLATSLFIPSIRTQQKNYEAAQTLLPLAPDQFEYLGFPPEAAATFRRDFAAAREKYILPTGELPGYLGSLLANLWLGNPGGKTGGTYYACVLPLHANDETPFRAIAEELEDVFFINKVKDIGTELDTLTAVMLLLLLAAYILIALLILRFYSRKHTLRICLAPFLSALVCITVLACLDIPLGFFSAVGLVLVFGLGLDYMFYITENERTHETDPGRHLTVSAIVLSFATTALSFGALTLSAFVPVHVFGLTVCTGLIAAFISSMLLA